MIRGLYIEKNGQDAWRLQCVPQCLTDILVQVSSIKRDPNDVDEEYTVEFTFHIGELMREMIEDQGTLDGDLDITDIEALNIERWARQLEIYATLMRSALRCRRPQEPT
jgi:hypothetical protein